MVVVGLLLGLYRLVVMWWLYFILIFLVNFLLMLDSGDFEMWVWFILGLVVVGIVDVLLILSVILFGMVILFLLFMM